MFTSARLFPARDVQHVLHTLVGQLPVNFRQPLRGNPHAIVRYAQRTASVSVVWQEIVSVPFSKRDSSP